MVGFIKSKEAVFTQIALLSMDFSVNKKAIQVLCMFYQHQKMKLCWNILFSKNLLSKEEYEAEIQKKYIENLGITEYEIIEKNKEIFR